MSGEITVLVLLSIGLIGSADFFGGLASRRTDSFTVGAVSQWAGVPFIALLAALIDSSYIATDVWLGALAGVGSAGGVLALYRGFSVGSIGIVAPVASTTAATIPIVVGLVSGERPSVVVIGGLVLGLVSVILVGYIPGNARLSTASVVHGLVAGVGFGLMVLAYSWTSEASGLAPAVSGRTSAALVATAAVLAIGAPRSVRRSAVLATVLAGALAAVGTGAFVAASQQGDLVIVGVAVALFPAVTVLLASIFLKDRLEPSQWIGLVLAVVAITLISTG
jgi:drug/metabolite transporter (DMT)-like permease